MHVYSKEEMWYECLVREFFFHEIELSGTKELNEVMFKKVCRA